MTSREERLEQICSLVAPLSLFSSRYRITTYMITPSAAKLLEGNVTT